MVFIFEFVNVYHIDWFLHTEESLYPWYNLIMVYELFDVLLNSVFFHIYC